MRVKAEALKKCLIFFRLATDRKVRQQMTSD